MRTINLIVLSVLLAVSAQAGVIPSSVRSFSKSGSTKLKGDVTISAGTNITLTQTGQNIQIDASASSSTGSDFFVLNGNLDSLGALPILDIDGVRKASASMTVTEIKVCAYNSGSGTTTVRFNYGAALGSNSSVSLSGNSATKCATSGAISLSLSTSDLRNLDLTALGTGVVDLAIEVVH
jgi:hypothetical protein